MKNFMDGHGQCEFPLRLQKENRLKINLRWGQPPSFQTGLVTHFTPPKWSKMGHLLFFDSVCNYFLSSAKFSYISEKRKV